MPRKQPNDNYVAVGVAGIRKRRELAKKLAEEAVGFFQPEEDDGAAHDHMKSVMRRRFEIILSKHV